MDFKEVCLALNDFSCLEMLQKEIKHPYLNTTPLWLYTLGAKLKVVKNQQSCYKRSATNQNIYMQYNIYRSLSENQVNLRVNKPEIPVGKTYKKPTGLPEMVIHFWHSLLVTDFGKIPSKINKIVPEPNPRTPNKFSMANCQCHYFDVWLSVPCQ